jgi:cell cycle checkpoint protein
LLRRFVGHRNDDRAGVASLHKSLFTSYTLNTPPAQDDEEGPIALPSFQISLPALLETLQIFGVIDAATRQAKADAEPGRSNLRNYRPDAFSNQMLGTQGTCTLSYSEEGEPFNVIIDESGVKTTGSLITYVPEVIDEIPFDRDDVAFKIITQAKWLLDALVELAPTTPTRLCITATRREPFLRLSSSGPLGSSSVDFSRGRELLETFAVQERWSQVFKFDMIKSASEAMRVATKVSLRGDRQGVLSLQFMVETEGTDAPQWLHFTFVPYVASEEDEDDGLEDDDGDGEY